MTDKYEDLRKAAQKASPGPWRAAAFHPQILDGRSGSSQTLVCTVAVNTFNDEGRHNEAFIAAANPAAILELLAERDRLRDALEDLAEAGEDAWGAGRPCVKVARAALNREVAQ